MRSTAIVILGLLAAAAALAQGPCDNAITRSCDGIFIHYDISTTGWDAPATVCGEPWISCSETVFEITLPSPATLTADIAFPGGSGAPFMTLLEDCAGDVCVNQTAVSGDMSWSNCLPAGTYYLVISDQTCLFYQFALMLTCTPCDPVATGPRTWGALKSLFR